MSTLANQTGLETLAETIFEEMIKSFKDLTPSEEQIVYDCACDEAIKQTSWQTAHQIPHCGDFLLLLKSQMNHTQMIDPRFEDEALSALMEEAFSQTEEETKFDVDAYFNSNIDY